MSTWLEPAQKWRLVRLHLGWDLTAEAGGGSHSISCAYAVPDDGRNLGDLTLAELRAYPAATAAAMLDEIVGEHRKD